jgi:MFS family permease
VANVDRLERDARRGPRSSTAARRGPAAVLAYPQFRLLCIGTTLSMLAFGMMQVVQGVVAFDLTGRNGAVGLVSLGQGIAMLTLSPIGGTLSDRISKKRLLTWTQFVIGVTFAVVAVLIATNWITIQLLACATLVMGCMFAVMSPTRQAWTADLLDGADLAHGVALQQLIQNGTRIIGPLIAGALIATDGVGTAGTYFSMALLFAGVVVVLAMMAPSPPRQRVTRTSVSADLAAGFRYIWGAPVVRLYALTFVGVVLSAFTYSTLMPGYLVHALGHPANQVGLLFGAAAAGGVAVTLLLTALPLRNPSAAMLGAGGALAASLALLAVVPDFPTALLVAPLIGASSSAFQMLNNVNLMRKADPAFLGRVMATTLMAYGLQSIFAYPIGTLADRVGERGAFGMLAGACALVIVVGALGQRTIPAQDVVTSAR